MIPAETLVVLGHGKANLLLHVHAILASTGLDKGPIKEVTIVCDVHTWLHLRARLVMEHGSSIAKLGISPLITITMHNTP